MTVKKHAFKPEIYFILSQTACLAKGFVAQLISKLEIVFFSKQFLCQELDWQLRMHCVV